MAQTKAKSLMESYAALSATERAEFDAMRTGYDMRAAGSQQAGKKAAETKKRTAGSKEPPILARHAAEA